MPAHAEEQAPAGGFVAVEAERGQHATVCSSSSRIKMQVSAHHKGGHTANSAEAKSTRYSAAGEH